jgi:hypothetical protein
MSQPEKNPPEKGPGQGPGPTPGQSFVTVTIDGEPRQVHRGSHRVADLKVLLGVDPVKALDVVVDGQLRPLEDDDRWTIKGGEVFFSRARTGGAS